VKSSPPVGFRKRLWRSGTWLRCDYVRGRPGLRDPVGVGGGSLGSLLPVVSGWSRLWVNGVNRGTVVAVAWAEVNLNASSAASSGMSFDKSIAIETFATPTEAIVRLLTV